MIFVPAIAFLRQYGWADAFTPFGIPVLAARGTKIEWMAAPADLFPDGLGFGLSALILGHVAMALVHRLVWKDGTLDRMV